MTVFVVFGGIVFLVVAYFALNWWLAGRTTRRSLPDHSPGHIHPGGGGGHEDRIHNLDEFKGTL